MEYLVWMIKIFIDFILLLFLLDHYEAKEFAIRNKQESSERLNYGKLNKYN